MRSYGAPQASVWEIEVESRRTPPLLDNPYELDVTVLGADFGPETAPEVKVGTPVTADWKVTNNYAALDGKLVGGPLGSAKNARSTIADAPSRSPPWTSSSATSLTTMPTSACL